MKSYLSVESTNSMFKLTDWHFSMGRQEHQWLFIPWKVGQKNYIK